MKRDGSMSGEERQFRKRLYLRIGEGFCMIAYVCTPLFADYYHAPLWLGIALTILFCGLYGALYFMRTRPPRRKLLIELATIIPLFLLFIYVAFFLRT